MSSSRSPRLNTPRYSAPASGLSATQTRCSPLEKNSRPCEPFWFTASTSSLAIREVVYSSLLGRSPPKMRGDWAMLQRLITVRCSTGVNREWRSVPRSATIPIRPNGSMSPSGHAPGRPTPPQMPTRVKFSWSSRHSSQKSSETRHMFGFWRRNSRLEEPPPDPPPTPGPGPANAPQDAYRVKVLVEQPPLNPEIVGDAPHVGVLAQELDILRARGSGGKAQYDGPPRLQDCLVNRQDLVTMDGPQDVVGLDEIHAPSGVEA